MKPPKMILFDYGETLFTEVQHGLAAGHEAVLRRALRNPNGTTAAELSELELALWDELAGGDPCSVHEIDYMALQKYMHTCFGLEFRESPQELEAVLWEATSPGRPVPHIAELLAVLAERGIRTGVISNLCFCEKTLRDRIDAGLPGHRFEFMLVSRDYGFRKPSPRLFEAALKKAGLSADEVWFCGNDPHCDVEGAAGAGLYPVWYTGTLRGVPSPPRCSCREIKDWAELAGEFQPVR